MPLEATLRDKNCKVCGQTFKPRSAAQRYCSDECKRGTRICRNCRQQFVPTKGSEGKYCSHGCWKVHYRERKAHTCQWCGEAFSPPSPSSKYCSRPCADQAKRKPRPERCEKCGGPFEKRTKPGQRFCSPRCASLAAHDRPYDNRAHPVGHVKVESSGYARIKTPDGWQLEHRYVMSEAIGRALRPDETVHHKNGRRDDNRLENLELRSGSHGRGQTTDDLLAHIVAQPEIMALQKSQRDGVREAVARVLCPPA